MNFNFCGNSLWFQFLVSSMMMHSQRGLRMGDIGHDRRLDYICSSPRLGQRCTINHQQSNRRILRGLRVVPSNVSLSTTWSWAQACALQCSSVHLGGTLTLHSILILNGYGVAIWKTLLKNLVTDHCQTSWAWACVGPAWGLGYVPANNVSLFFSWFWACALQSFYMSRLPLIWNICVFFCKN